MARLVFPHPRIHPLLTLVKVIVLSWASNLESLCALAGLDLFARHGQPQTIDLQLHPLL